MINDENRENSYGINVHNLNAFDLDAIRQEQLIGELKRFSEARFDKHGYDFRTQVSSGHPSCERCVVFGENSRTGREI